MTSNSSPLAGLHVVEMGSDITVPYVGKLLVDAGATVIKVESPAGDPLRRRRGSGKPLPDGEDSALWRYLNAGKSSVVADLDDPDGRVVLESLVADTDLVLDDHTPTSAKRLRIDPGSLAHTNAAASVATFTRFGCRGPWADRAANDFTLQALVGSTDGRGIPGDEPVACGGDLGDFVAAAIGAPGAIALALGHVGSGRGVHIDVSQFEAMMMAFQTYRPIYDSLAPDHRAERSIEIPSIEPASDGLVGFCTVTGQQWQDFCVMIGADDWIDDAELATFAGRMDRRDEVLPRIRAFTERHTVEEIVDLASAFRIPAGPIGTGDVVAGFDQFVERGVFVDSAHGFVQPRPAYRFSVSTLRPPQAAPELGADAGTVFGERTAAAPSLPGEANRPLEGVRILDLSAFWAGPVATNLLRVLGAELIKVESHVRLDGMRWASGLPIAPQDQLWEWSPVYHGANVGKKVVNLDLGHESGRELLEQLVATADVVVENFSPRVTEDWGLTWERVHELNDQAVYIRMPAFGLDGPWRDRVGFAMTMEQVSGLANRTGFADGPPLVPKGPVDAIAGMHAVVAVILALADRERSGTGQLIELPLIEGALQVAAQQAVEFSAYGDTLSRIGNRSMTAEPQGLYPTNATDVWLAVSVESDEQWASLQSVVPALGDLARGDRDAVDKALADWTISQHPEDASGNLTVAGIPVGSCVHPNDSGKSPQHDFRGFLQWRDHPVTGWTPYPSYPFQVDGAHLDLGDAAPMLGQHNAEVLASIGIDDAGILALVDAGITGDWPVAIPRPERS